MEIRIGTQQILKTLYVFSWFIFVGLCVRAGGIIVNSFFTLMLSPDGAKHFWQEIDLTNLYNYDPGYFFVATLMISIVSILEAIIFYLIIKILHGKNLNMSQPFSSGTGRFIFKVSYLALGIGLFSGWGVKYSEWLIKQGVSMPDIQYLHLGGADVWLFMGIILFIIAQIFKRGIEIQKENELTI